MLDSPALYIVVGVIGAVLLLIGLVFDDLFDLDELFDSDLPWLNTKVIAAGLVGFGIVGLVARAYDIPVSLVIVLAFLGFVGVAVLSYYVILKPLLKQQSNTLISRRSYVGKMGVVTMDIPANGWGQVRFTDNNRVTITEKAYAADNQALPKGASVLIIDIHPRDVIVTPQDEL